MRFVATHDVTFEDAARALRLTRRWADVVPGAVVALILGAMLWQVLYAFGLYLRAAAGSPASFIALLRFQGAAANAVLAWVSVVVTLGLPVFLFYSVRALVEALHPAWRARRLVRESDLSGPTTYTIDDHGVRSTKAGGSDVFMPWSAFDGVRSDGDIVVLLRGRRLMFFVPLRPFGTERDTVSAHLVSMIPGPKSSRSSRQPSRLS